ncbi:MAG: ATP-dependent Clp protease ATP-binding subunit ClpX [Acidobacteriota bacterium]
MHANGRELYQPPLLPLRTPREIYDHLDAYVVGQELAKRTMAIAAYNHLKRVAANPSAGRLLRKSNILMIGPSGSGKTHVARQLADAIGLPFTIVDATSYTEAGYYGKDVEVMVAELLLKTGQSVEMAQRGIIFIDEIDKIARRDFGARSGAGPRDVGGLGVQQALLKLLEGSPVFVPINVSQHWSKHEYVQVDTSDILFICAGTFSDLKRRRTSRVGFDRAAPSGAARRIPDEDLIEYGFLVEFLGRLPVVVELDELGEHELARILTGPPDALCKEYRALLAKDGVELLIAQDGVEEIARAARRRRTGARALRSLMEALMRDLMFEAPERSGSTVKIDRAFVRSRLDAQAEIS